MSHYSRFLVLAFATFWLGVSTAAFAQAADEGELQTNVYAEKSVKYVLVIPDDGMWKFQVFESKNGELQQLIRDREFKTRHAAVNAYNEYLKFIGYKAPEPVVSQPGDEGEMADLGVLTGPTVRDNGTSLWPLNKTKWNWDDEVGYSNWVASNEIKENFFLKYDLPASVKAGTPWKNKKGIPTDCADVVIALNWIYAYEHGLPIANRLAGSGEIVGNMTFAPDLTPAQTAKTPWHENEKFMSALLYVMKGTYTGSLSGDSYPIKITNESLIPGTHHLELHGSSGHAMLIKQVRPMKGNTLIVTLNSTLPTDVRRLIVKEYVYGEQAHKGTGFMRMLRPSLEDKQWGMVEPSQHESYSTEQYKPEFMGNHGIFSMAVKAKLSNSTEFSRDEFKRTFEFLTLNILSRKKGVIEGFTYCSQPGADCSKGTDAWDEFSTPGRDSTLKGLVSAIAKEVELNAGNRNMSDLWDPFSKDTFNYGDGTMSVEDVVTVFSQGKFSSDPRDAVRVRWGQ